VRVLHVMPSLARSYGGPVTALAGYVSAGAVVGVQATVVGPRCDDSDAAWLRAQMPDSTLVMAGESSAGPWSGAPAVLKVLRPLLADADVVHVHGLLNPTSSGASRVAISTRRPVVIGPFGTMSPYTFSYRRVLAKRVYFRCIDAPNLRRASALHFTTAKERAEAAWHGIESDSRSYIVPPPYQRLLPGWPLEQSPPAPPVVLFLGRLHPTKGVDVLLESWDAVADEYPSAELRIAGSGSARYTARIRRQAERLGAASSIRFVGFVADADKERHLRDASLLVLPSRHENFGIAVLDAVAAGRPVIVTPAVQLAPWVAEQGVGRVAERTPAAIGRAIVELLRDGALRARVASIGAAAVARVFGPCAVAPALEAMYQGALACRPRSP
jgi:glycosyltransferase involved in cell wall biosynthesis